jgi:hypothetical protein
MLRMVTGVEVLLGEKSLEGLPAKNGKSQSFADAILRCDIPVMFDYLTYLLDLRLLPRVRRRE